MLFHFGLCFCFSEKEKKRKYEKKIIRAVLFVCFFVFNSDGNEIVKEREVFFGMIIILVGNDE